MVLSLISHGIELVAMPQVAGIRLLGDIIQDNSLIHHLVTLFQAPTVYRQYSKQWLFKGGQNRDSVLWSLEMKLSEFVSEDFQFLKFFSLTL